jgi:2-polyprenyl-3-methyl-5-hydroxy-6-metoxy-1,4-benzoquinol methylase
VSPMAVGFSPSATRGDTEVDCEICGTLMHRLTVNRLRCGNCGLQASTLRPKINDASLSSAIDETSRLMGLENTRKQHFRTILDKLELLIGRAGASPSLLDVGCAHGWFLELASEYKYEATGVEVDRSMIAILERKRLPVLFGHFPEVLHETHRLFDVIVFNDVFEHIPNCNSVLDSTGRYLQTGGLLVLNIPSSDGLFFKLASLVDRLGIRVVLRRLWQDGFPSPHLYYFNSSQIRLLAQKHGFKYIDEVDLAPIAIRGLWNRIAYDRNLNRLLALVTFVSVLVIMPFIKVLPKDTVVCFLQKQ